MIEQPRLARLYARACVNVYFDKLSEEVITRVIALCDFFARHPRTDFFLKLTRIPATDKKRILKQACEQYQLDVSQSSLCNSLLDVLMQHNRLFLFNKVLQHIVAEYRERHNLMTCELSSSPVLSEEEQEEIIAFVERKTGKQIAFTYAEDPKLIAGIRVQSDQYYWEASVARQLREMRPALRNL